MKYYIFFLLLLFVSCSSIQNDIERRDIFKVGVIDYEIFNNYCVYVLKNSSGKTIILFSDKKGNGNNILLKHKETKLDSTYSSDSITMLYSDDLNNKEFPLDKYNLIKSDSLYEIEIYKDTNKYILTPYLGNIRTRSTDVAIFYGDILLISRDTVKAQIYRSKEIIDRYIERKNKKQ